MDILIGVRCWNARTQHAVHGSGIQEGSLLRESGVLHCSTLSLLRTPQKLHSGAEICLPCRFPLGDGRGHLCAAAKLLTATCSLALQPSC